jgi:hypothetical protein
LLASVILHQPLYDVTFIKDTEALFMTRYHNPLYCAGVSISYDTSEGIMSQASE